MTAAAFNYDTGGCMLPDIGTLSYNGVKFSSLFTSEVNGPVVQDDAKRTTKYMEWTLTVEGTVTLKDGDTTIDTSFINLKRKLSVAGAPLIYTGRGFGKLAINTSSGVQDVAWGPTPKVLFFQPYGQGRSARIRWQVTFHVTELPDTVVAKAGKLGTTSTGGVLQWSYGATIKYDEDGYSGLTLKGVLEIPLTRNPDDLRKVQTTVDAFREAYLDIQVDLTNFAMPTRSFDMSADKRTYQWEYSTTELPPMGKPENCSTARGKMSIRGIRSKASNGISVLVGSQWEVHLSCTYTVRKDKPRRWALWHFYSLLWFRMKQAQDSPIPALNNSSATSQQEKPPFTILGVPVPVGPVLQQQNQKQNVILSGFDIEEGLMDDSKSITLEASWVILTNFTSIIAASGLWKIPQKKKGPPGTIPTGIGGKDWAISMQDIAGWRSWLENAVDPGADIIIDMGGGKPVSVQPIS